ncbi:hypothetical protein PFISCL1PPCAC_10728, partial [Pristionchus fissidentatus]
QMQEGSSQDEKTTPRVYSSGGMRGEYSAGSLLRQPIFSATADLQVSPYIQKMEITEEGRGRKGRSGANVSGVNRIHSFRIFELGLRRIFWHLGKVIANRPAPFIILPLLLLSALIIPSFFLKDQSSISLDFGSFTSDGNTFGRVSSILPSGRPLISFNDSTPNFDAQDRMSSIAYSAIMSPLDDRESILRKETTDSFLQLKRRLEGFDSNKNAWTEICASDCEGASGLIDRLIKKSSEIPMTYPEMFISTSKEGNNLTKLYLAHVIGGVDTDLDGAIAFARSLRMTFKLNGEKADNETMRRWRINFNHQVDTESAANDHLSVNKWSYTDFLYSTTVTIRESYSWLLVSTAVLGLFCILSVFGPNAYQSKPLVGFIMALVLLSVCTASASVHFIVNSRLQPLIFPIFFIISGIGIVFIYSYHLTWAKFSAAAMHPGEKLAFLMSHDLPGVVLSVVVVAIAFLGAGLSSSISLIRESFFLLSSSLSLLLPLIILLVSVAVYLSGKRETQGIKWFELCRTGDNQFCAPQMSIFDSFSMFSLHDRLLDSRPSITRSIGAFLVHPHFRYPTVILCSVYLFVAAFGCINANVDLREEFFLPTSSTPSKYMQHFRTLFGHTEEYLELSFDRSIDYWDDHTRRSIITDLLEAPVNDQYATRAVSWLTEFARFEKSSIYDISHETFVPVVNLVFLPSDQYRRFTNDVIFDRFQTQIIRSRMYLELTQKGVARRSELITDLLAKARKANLPLSIKAPFMFSLKHDIEMLSSTTSTFFILLTLLFLLSLLLFAQPALSLILAFTSVAVLIETIAYSSFLGVPVNIVTATVAMAANSLTCIIVLSFCFHYSMSGRGHMGIKERIQYTYQSTLAPVTFACFVPVITFIPVLSVDAPIVQHIWKVLLVSSMASFIHFLFFLPNLLLLLTHFAPRLLRHLKCESCCKEDDGSIYYIPTAPRPIRQTDGIYSQAEYATYTIPRSIAPPGYLAIEPVYGLDAYCVSTMKRGREMEGEQGRGRRPSSRAVGQVEMPESRPESVAAKPGETSKSGRVTRNNSRAGEESVYERIPVHQKDDRTRRSSRLHYDQTGRAYYEDVSLPSYPVVAGYHVPGSVHPVYAPSPAYVVPQWKHCGSANPTGASSHYHGHH